MRFKAPPNRFLLILTCTIVSVGVLNLAYLHCNAGPLHGIRFERVTFWRANSFLLAPIAISGLGFSLAANERFVRAAAWAVSILAFITSVGVATVMCMNVRPLIGYAEYDRAVDQCGQTLSEAVILPPELVEKGQALNREIADADSNPKRLEAIISTCDTLSEEFERRAEVVQRWPTTARSIFVEHGVNKRRTDWYLDHIRPILKTDRWIDSNSRAIQRIVAIKEAALNRAQENKGDR